MRTVSMRPVDVATTLVGGISVLAPHVVMRVAGAPDDVAAERTVRALGARQVVQGLAVALHPTRGARMAAVAVDATHAASMLALAGLDARARRAALLSAAVAGAFAVVNGLQL